MKKILIFIFLFIGIKGLIAQSLTLLTFESYTFADKVITQEGLEGQIGDGFQWGGGLELGLGDNALELIYQRLDTEGYIDYLNVRDRGDLAIDYILLGGTRYLPVTDKVSGFGTFDAGLGIYTTKENTTDETPTKFVWGGRLGLRIAPNDRVSIRLHGQLLSTVQALGGGIYFGTGGTGAGLSGYSTVWQFNLGGSVNIRLK